MKLFFYPIIILLFLGCGNQENETETPLSGNSLLSDKSYWEITSQNFTNVKVTTITDTRANSDKNNFGPYGVYANDSFIYVADLYQNRVIRLNTDYTFNSWLGSGNAWLTSTFQKLPNSSTPGKFHQPHSIDISCNNELYITEWGNGRVQIFNTDGVYLRKLSNTLPSGQSLSIQKLPSAHFSPTCDLFVADGVMHRVLKYNQADQLIGWVGKPVDSNPPSSFLTTNTNSEESILLGGFKQPHVISFDTSGNFYVAGYNHRIQKFDSSGDFLGWIGATSTGGTTNGFEATGTSVASSLNGGLNMPVSVDLGASNFIYVADHSNNRINKFNAAGEFVGWMGVNSTGNFTDGWSNSGTAASSSKLGGLNGPTDIQVFKKKILVTDLLNSRVVIYEFGTTVP